MADKANPAIPVKLGGKLRPLKYGFRARYALIEEGGPRFYQELGAEGGFTEQRIALLIWAGLIHAMPRLYSADRELRRAGIFQVGEWIMEGDSDPLDVLSAKALEAWKLGLPDDNGDAEEEADDEKNAQAARTGSGSSPSGASD